MDELGGPNINTRFLEEESNQRRKCDDRSRRERERENEFEGATLLTLNIQ